MKKKTISNRLKFKKQTVSNLNTLVGGALDVPQNTRNHRCIVSQHYGCPETFLNTCNLSEAGPSVCFDCPADDPLNTDQAG